MFETEEFRSALERAVSGAAGGAGMAKYQIAIVGNLQNLAIANETPLMAEEMKKAVAARRGTPDALASARDLVKDACAIAARAKRTTVQWPDVEEANRARLCQFWPFCR